MMADVNAQTHYRIHEFAQLAGVTVKALHHYDRVGLLKPARTAAGYRAYTLRDLERLEQIVALKFVGLSLREIATLLSAKTLPIGEGLRRQRRVLEERRRALDRAIDALSAAERAVGADEQSNAAVLKTLIEVIAVHDDIEAMKRYYSDDAWPRARATYERWPSEAWSRLLRDVEAALGLAPSSEPGQALASRWVALVKEETGGEAALYAGWWKAWTDRDAWPPTLRARLAEFDVDRITRFIADATWELVERERAVRGTTAYRAPDRVSEAKMTLFHEIGRALDADPSGGTARPLVVKWREIVEEELAVDPGARASVAKFRAARGSWPSGLRIYMASLYRMEPPSFERVLDFIERT